jgi:hypothetical protein
MITAEISVAFNFRNCMYWQQMNVIIAKSDGRTGASGRRTGDPATWC